MPEVDPLLPCDQPAPEVSGLGYGSTKIERARAEEDLYSPAQYHHTEPQADNDDNDALRSDSISQRLGQMFVSTAGFVVLCGFIWFLLKPHRSWSPQPSPLHPIPGRPSHPIPPHQSIAQRADRILTDTPLIDGHNDLAILIRGVFKNAIKGDDFRKKFESGGMPAQVDLPRLKKGRMGGAFWSAFVACPNNASKDFSDEEYAAAVAHTLQQIDLVRRLQHQYPTTFTPAGSSITTMLDKFHASRSLFGPISIEGLHQVPQTSAMSTLRLYYSLGVRAATLTWNCHNAFADAALITTRNGTTIAPYHRGGLTEQGRKLITEMNRLGMLVDISHTSYWTQKAVLSNATSRSPVVFTHSSAFELCPHPRNVKDDILDLVKATDSLVMVNFNPDFISCTGDGVGMPEFDPQNSTIHQVARHVVYIGDRIGYDHVGFGSDFDGIESTPEGLDGVDKYPDLVAELLKMGVSDEDASKVVGGNLLRVWRQAESVAAQMEKEGVPEGEDKVVGY